LGTGGRSVRGSNVREVPERASEPLGTRNRGALPVGVRGGPTAGEVLASVEAGSAVSAGMKASANTGDGLRVPEANRSSASAAVEASEGVGAGSRTEG